MAWKHRKRWSARMLKRELHGSGGGGFGFRPCLRLRIPLADVAPTLNARRGAVLRPHQLPAPIPGWFDFDGAAEHGDARFWKFVDLHPVDGWLVVELSAYGDRHAPPPLVKVATAINRAHADGVRIQVEVADHRGRRWWDNPVRQERNSRRWARVWRQVQAASSAQGAAGSPSASGFQNGKTSPRALGSDGHDNAPAGAPDPG